MPKKLDPAAAFVAARGDILRTLSPLQLEAMEEGPLRDIPSELGEWKFYFSRTKLQNGRTRFVVEGEAEENIRAGVRYLKQLLARFGQNEELALAAYNAGVGAVERYGMTVPPYPETRLYLARLRELTTVSTECSMMNAKC